MGLVPSIWLLIPPLATTFVSTQPQAGSNAKSQHQALASLDWDLARPGPLGSFGTLDADFGCRQSSCSAMGESGYHWHWQCSDVGGQARAEIAMHAASGSNGVDSEGMRPFFTQLQFHRPRKPCSSFDSKPVLYSDPFTTFNATLNALNNTITRLNMPSQPSTNAYDAWAPDQTDSSGGGSGSGSGSNSGSPNTGDTPTSGSSNSITRPNLLSRDSSSRYTSHSSSSSSSRRPKVSTQTAPRLLEQPYSFSVRSSRPNAAIAWCAMTAERQIRLNGAWGLTGPGRSATSAGCCLPNGRRGTFPSLTAELLLRH